MRWIHDFDLFLFDFDGLLVNTEHLHYQAYVNVLDGMGHRLDLSFGNFLELAHFNSKAWKEAIFTQIPEIEADWKVVYQKKKENYLSLVGAGKVDLMPGAKELLSALEEAEISRCVVTNSPFEQTQLLASQIPVLSTIPKWITRENYEKPKPNSECYLKAIELYGKPGARIIGFEDSVRGLQALLGTPALAVLICQNHYPLLEIALEKGGVHFESLTSISEDKLVHK